MRRDDLNLDLERRRAILELVRTYPGLHLSELARRLEWSPMLTEYHLRVLERHNLVSSIQEAHYRRYYAKTEREGLSIDTMGAHEKRVLALLRHPVRLHVVTYLAAEGHGRNKEIAKSLGLSRPATSYQLGKLHKAGIVLKNEQDVYRLADADTVTALLLAHKPPADLVEGFRDLWDRLSEPPPARRPPEGGPEEAPEAPQEAPEPPQEEPEAAPENP